MSSLVRCDRCDAERRSGDLTGWAHLTFYPQKTRPGRLGESRNLDLCEACADHVAKAAFT